MNNCAIIFFTSATLLLNTPVVVRGNVLLLSHLLLFMNYFLTLKKISDIWLTLGKCVHENKLNKAKNKA